jgi:hypothetical protein
LVDLGSEVPRESKERSKGQSKERLARSPTVLEKAAGTPTIGVAAIGLALVHHAWTLPRERKRDGSACIIVLNGVQNASFFRSPVVSWPSCGNYSGKSTCDCPVRHIWQPFCNGQVFHNRSFFAESPAVDGWVSRWVIRQVRVIRTIVAIRTNGTIRILKET